MFFVFFIVLPLLCYLVLRPQSWINSTTTCLLISVSDGVLQSVGWVHDCVTYTVCVCREWVWSCWETAISPARQSSMSASTQFIVTWSTSSTDHTPSTLPSSSSHSWAINASSQIPLRQLVRSWFGIGAGSKLVRTRQRNGIWLLSTPVYTARGYAHIRAQCERVFSRQETVTEQHDD